MDGFVDYLDFGKGPRKQWWGLHRKCVTRSFQTMTSPDHRRTIHSGFTQPSQQAAPAFAKCIRFQALGCVCIDAGVTHQGQQKCDQHHTPAQKWSLKLAVVQQPGHQDRSRRTRGHWAFECSLHIWLAGGLVIVSCNLT